MDKVVINDSQEKLLDDLYYNEKHKSALRGIQPLYKAAKNKDPAITLRIVKDWLKYAIYSYTATYIAIDIFQGTVYLYTLEACEEKLQAKQVQYSVCQGIAAI